MKGQRRPCLFALYAALLCGVTMSPPAAFAWSFAACGDSRNDVNGVFPKIVAAVQRSEMELLLHVGDLENPGGTAAWTSFRAKLAPLKKPFLVALGNHERRGATKTEFVRFFGLPGPSYSFVHRDARFIIMDTSDGSLPDETLSWLDRELAAHPKGTDGVSYLIVATHYPPALPGLAPHGTRGPYEEQSRKLHEILTRHNVDLFLCGHEHLHLVFDWNSVKVIVTGEAGAPLVPLFGYGFYKVELSGGKVRETRIPVEK